MIITKLREVIAAKKERDRARIKAQRIVWLQGYLDDLRHETNKGRANEKVSNIHQHRQVFFEEGGFRLARVEIIHNDGYSCTAYDGDLIRAFQSALNQSVFELCNNWGIDPEKLKFISLP